MAVLGTDLLVVERDGTLHSAPVSDLPASGGGPPVATSFGTSNKTALSQSQFFSFTVTGGADEVYPVSLVNCNILYAGIIYPSFVLRSGETYTIRAIGGNWAVGTTSCAIISNGRKEEFTVTLSGGGP